MLDATFFKLHANKRSSILYSGLRSTTTQLLLLQTVLLGILFLTSGLKGAGVQGTFADILLDIARSC